MERDGVYYSKHSIGQSQDINGVSITVSGNESVPTNVEFKEVLIDALLENTGLISNKDRNTSNSKIEKTEFGDWPMFRKDRTNSAHSELQGVDFSNNKVAWSYSLGGFSGIHHTADLNNDLESCKFHMTILLWINSPMIFLSSIIFITLKLISL